MTNKDYTALLFIVDESGSMYPIAHDMQGGISALVDQQLELPGKLTVDYTTFSTRVRNHYVLADPRKRKLSFFIHPSGGTALYDAVGSKINEFGKVLAAMPEDERPENVIVAIVTDGHENSSREYTAVTVKEMVKHQTDVYGWNFTYLGANQDAVYVASGLGIDAGAALTYNTANVHAMTQTFGSYTTNVRSGLAVGYTDEDRLRNA